MAPSVSRLYVIEWWVTNRQAIASTECVNRFDASVMCGGHCVLVKELSKIDKSHETADLQVLNSILKGGTDVFTADLPEPGVFFIRSIHIAGNNFPQILFSDNAHCPQLYIPPSC